jgi:hypothetical protein
MHTAYISHPIRIMQIPGNRAGYFLKSRIKAASWQVQGSTLVQSPVRT